MECMHCCMSGSGFSMQPVTQCCLTGSILRVWKEACLCRHISTSQPSSIAGCGSSLYSKTSSDAQTGWSML